MSSKVSSLKPKLRTGASTTTLRQIGNETPIAIGDDFNCGPFADATKNGIWTTHSTIVNGQATDIKVSESMESGGDTHETNLSILNRCARGIFATSSGLLLLDSVEVSDTSPIAHLTRIDGQDARR